MKVRELIDKLGRFNPETEVISTFGEFWYLDAVNFVDKDPANTSQVILDSDDELWQCKYPETKREVRPLSMQLVEAMVQEKMKDLASDIIESMNRPNHLLERLRAKQE